MRAERPISEPSPLPRAQNKRPMSLILSVTFAFPAGRAMLVLCPTYTSQLKESDMKAYLSAFVLLIAGGIAPDLLAHGGHGVTAPSGIAHYLIEPLHLLSAFLPLALIAVTVTALRYRNTDRG